ncbi:MAG: putative Histidine kinase [Promethearchaeota archaeon]|nr:MAG: putative Histidine kinase [Candidatus Lokiarchaeota archaeon]
MLAHDISNILNNINLSLQLAASESNSIKLPEKLRFLPRMIRSQVQDGLTLLSNIQKISELETKKIEIEKVDAGVLLEEIITNLTLCNNSDVLFEIEKPDTKIEVLADAFLKDIFENILLNGIKHNQSENKWIKVRISYEYYKENENIVPTKFVKFEFIDNGIGIPDALKQKIFNRQHRSTISSKGMGIGLSLVKTLIDAFNGKIWVDNLIKNDYTKGSIFTVLIPKA